MINKFNITLAAILISFSIGAYAQFVTIPDANFANYLGTILSAPAINGNQLDTTHTQVVNLNGIYCTNKNISSLDGIQYFDNLDTLFCNNNLLTSLPVLPSSLIQLNCQSNQLTSLPTLPSSLTLIHCATNQLTTLPALPSTLSILYCSGNQLTSLPTLPSQLEVLHTGENQLTTLPPLPPSLTFLDCTNNLITSLPALPGSLTNLQCRSNQLTSLPVLPAPLYHLNCKSNQLTQLPNLPSALIILDCGWNQISILPNLPSSLEQLMCDINQITSLPLLPLSMTGIICSNNLLQSIPVLPPSLTSLSCGGNSLTSLPNLTSTSLTYLNCGYNQLTTIPPLPQSLSSLLCNDNQLTSLPILPDTLNTLYIRNNNLLTCLPELKTITTLDFTNTGVLCLPNYGNVTNSTPNLSSIPVCDIFNTNICDFYYNISGKVYSDNNNNCTIDPNENSISNLKINLFQGGSLIQQGYTSQLGNYTLDTQLGSFDYAPDTSGVPFFVSCPPSGIRSSILTTIDSIDIGMDFGIECKPGFDVGISAVSQTSGQFFPADTSIILISAGDMSNFYNMNCASGIGGSVTINYIGPVQYAGNVPGSLLPILTPNTLTYTIPDFGQLNFYEDIQFYITTDTNAQSGQQVCFNINVTPVLNDSEPANNTLTHCYQVVNSFDPNDKQVHPDGDIYVWDEWLNYTIRFQNTGTAPAQHIVITDTLDNNLQESTFAYLGSSHHPFTQINGNVVKFTFGNINLPDSTSDEPNSHGYIQYKIKVDESLPIGSTIENTAAIYFDFNAPVITNTTYNTVVAPTGFDEINNQQLHVYPNPANNQILIKTSNISVLNGTISIHDLTGKSIYSEKFKLNEHRIDVGYLSKGVYFIVLETNNNKTLRNKFIISR